MQDNHEALILAARQAARGLATFAETIPDGLSADEMQSIVDVLCQQIRERLLKRGRRHKAAFEALWTIMEGRVRQAIGDELTAIRMAPANDRKSA